jgi:hypothetical protein
MKIRFFPMLMGISFFVLLTVLSVGIVYPAAAANVIPARAVVGEQQRLDSKSNSVSVIPGHLRN